MPAISPRTQSLATSGGGTSDQAKAMFDQGLTEMAYNVLLSKFPALAPDIITFKVLDTKHEEGSGVGAFVLQRNQQTLYVPVVMADSQIKPLDILYFKELNVFLPLTKGWLDNLDKQQLNDLGRGATPPRTMPTDVDIRNTVVPPTTGRYSYASEATAVKTAGRVFDEARVQNDTEPLFIQFLRAAPNRVKKACADLFEQRPTLLKQAALFHGVPALTSALAFVNEKVADYGGRVGSTGGALYILDDKSPAQEFKDIFGAESGVAYSGVRLKGYASKDSRKDIKRALKVQPFLDLQEPRHGGVYKFWKTDGKPVVALITENPVNLGAPTGVGTKVPARNIRFRETNFGPADPYLQPSDRYRVPGQSGTTDNKYISRFIGVTTDGQLIDAEKLVGSLVAFEQLKGSEVFNKLLEDSPARPRSGQTGVFIRKTGASFVVTTPVKVSSVSTDADGCMRIKFSADAFGATERTMCIDENRGGQRILVPKDGPVHLPREFIWVPVKGMSTYGDDVLQTKDFLHSEKDIVCWQTEQMAADGGFKVKVGKYTGEPGYNVAGEYADGYVSALRKLASKAEISVPDAEYALKQASELGVYAFWTLPEKKAAALETTLLQRLNGEKTAAPGAQDPNAGAPADPAQQAMDGMMQAPMQAPQGPSPIDMAVAEQLQSIQGQMTALQQMQQMVQTIQQRANMIAGGGGAAGAPAAAAAAMGGPMDPSMMGAGQAVPGLMPQQGAPQPGMDPMAAQQGMPQQGGDPSQQQPPAAMMSGEDSGPEMLAQQVNPQFMDSAAALNDAGVFDASALASMAQAPSLKELVAGYLPSLEKALDNLGRTLLTLWMDEDSIKTDIGLDAYVKLEDNMRSTFRGLGELLLRINQESQMLKQPV